jgi:hypothetical protein
VHSGPALSSSDRYSYANITGAETLVSVHMNGSSNPGADYTTTLFGKWRKDKELAYSLFAELSTPPAATARGTIANRDPHSFASGVFIKSDMPATSPRPFLSRATPKEDYFRTAPAPASSG